MIVVVMEMSVISHSNEKVGTMLVPDVRSFYGLGFAVGLNELTVDFEGDVSVTDQNNFELGIREGAQALAIARLLGRGELSKDFVDYRKRKKDEVGL